MGNDSRRGLLLCGLLLLLGRAVPLAAQTCASPSIFPAAGGTFNGTTTGTGSVAGSCGSSLSSPEWVFSWTPTTSGVATIQLCGAGTTFDTVLYMRVGSCAGAEVSTGTAACGGAVGCNDDCAGCLNASGLARASKLTPTVTGGQTYIIVVDGFGTASRGNFTLSVTAPSGGSTTTTTPGATTTTTTTTLYRPPSYPTNLQVKTIDCGAPGCVGSACTPTVQLTWNASTPGTATLQGYAVYLWNGQQFVPDHCNTGGCPGGATHSYSCCTGSPNAGILYINGNFPCVGSLCTFTETLDFPGWPFYAVVAFDNSGPSGFSPSPPTCAAPDIGGNGVCGPGLFNGCTPYPCFQCTYNGTTPNTTSWCDPTVAQKCGDCSPCVVTTTTTTTLNTTTTLLSGSGTAIWATRYGGSSADVGQSVSISPNGRLVVGGYFVGSVDFGLGALVGAGSYDGVVADYASDGSCVAPACWTRRIGSTGIDKVVAVATTSDNGVVVVGVFQGTVDFGGTSKTAATNQDVFVARYGSTGTLTWVRNFGGAPGLGCTANMIPYACCTGVGTGTCANTIAISAVGVDSADDVIATGYLTGTANFDAAVLASAGPSLYVAKLGGSNGAVSWATRYPNSGDNYSYALAVDGNTDVFIGGTFINTLDISGGSGAMVFTSPTPDAFVAKVSGVNGASIWNKRVGDSNANAQTNGLAVDGAGNVFATGTFSSTVSWGGSCSTLTSNLPDNFTGPDAFVAKLSGGNGTCAWSRNFTPNNNSDFGLGIAVDGSGNALVSGSFTGAVNFGTSTLTSFGDQDAFVTKLAASNGNTLWAWRGGGTQSDRALAVSVRGSTIASTGFFYGTANFGTGSKNSAGGSDVFVVSLVP